MKITQLFERVWNQCPTVAALDQNIGNLERGWDIARVMREHVRGEEWERRFIDGKNSDKQVVPLYDVYLARNVSRNELFIESSVIAVTKDYRTVEAELAGSPEFFNRFKKSNIVPGCGRDNIDCTWMRKQFSKGYLLLIIRCIKQIRNCKLQSCTFNRIGEVI